MVNHAPDAMVFGACGGGRVPPVIGGMTTEQDSAGAFIERWQGVTASELSTSQSFVIELCELLGVPRPHAAAEQDYMFERPITFQHGDGSSSAGRVDCYRRGAFIWESKKLKPGSTATTTGATTKAFDDALLRARAQGRGLCPRATGQRGPAAVSDGGGRGPCDRAVRRVHAFRRHLHPLSRSALAPHPPGRPGRPGRRRGAQPAQSSVGRPDVARPHAMAGRSRAGTAKPSRSTGQILHP